MSKRFFFFVLPLAFLSSACFFDAAVPFAEDQPLPEIVCRSDAECPSDWVCNKNSERCVPVSGIDSEPPALVGTPVLTPQLGGRGQEFVLQLQVSEALIENPVVELEIGGGELTRFTLDETGSDREALQYRYVYTSTGSEAEGSRLITIDLMDTSFNRVDALSGGGLLLDFSPPRITSASLDRTVARSGVPIELSIELSESLPAPPDLVMVHPSGESHPFVHTDVSGALGHVYSFTASGGEAEGIYTVRATGADAVGNPFDDPQVATLTLDFTAPEVVTTQVVPQLAAAGQRVVVEVELSETLASFGGLSAESSMGGDDAHVYTEVGNTQTLIRFEHTVMPDSDGDFELNLTDLVDLAGNTTTGVVVGGVSYDTTPPALVDFQQSHSTALAADTVTVSFSSSEVLGSDPVVSLGGLTMNRVGTQTAPYTYALALEGTGLVGVQTVQVRIGDVVGNQALLQPGSVDVDAVPPGMVDLVFTPPAARLGVTAVLTVTASEPLAASPTLTWGTASGDPGFQELGPSGLGHLWALDVTPAQAAGIYEVSQVRLEDVAGNVTVVDTGGLFVLFEIDNQPPVLGTPTTDAPAYSAQSGHDTITLSFDGHDPVEGQPNQPLDTLEVSMAGQPFSCGAYQASSPNYTCTYTVTGSEPEGLNIIAVRAVDTAGNESATSAAVQLDFSAPTALSTQLRPAQARLGDAVVLNLNASEALGATPLIAVDGPASLTFTPIADTQYAYEHVVGIADTDGVYTLSTELVDLVGNRSGTVDLGAFDLDARVPEVTNLTMNRAKYSARIGFNLIVASFDISESVDNGSLEVLLDDAAMLCGNHQPSSPNYTCSYAVLGTEPEGLNIVSVRAADAAGNETLASTPVQIDFTAPSLVPGSAQVSVVAPPGALVVPTRAGIGSRVQASFMASEPTSGSPTISHSTLAFAVTASVQFTFVLEAAVTAATADGPVPLAVVLTDEVGNVSGPLPLGDVTIDQTPPASLGPGVLYTAIPWGDVSHASAHHEVGSTGGLAPAEPGATVIFFEGADYGASRELGRSVVDPAGELPVAVLSGPPLGRIFALVVDAAANPDSGSTATTIRDVDWIVAPGPESDNPMQLRTSGACQPQREPQSQSMTTVTGIELEDEDGNEVETLGSGHWKPITPADIIDPTGNKLDHVYDAVRGEVIYTTSSPALTWVWKTSSATWTAPGSDRASGRLFTDYSGRPISSTGWEWRRESAEWIETGRDLGGARSCAPFRSRGTLVCLSTYYDDSTTPATPYIRTMELDGQVFRDAGIPMLLDEAGASLLYDPQRDVMLLIRGVETPVESTEIWEWDGSPGGWSLVTAADHGYGKIWAMGYDPTSDSFVAVVTSPWPGLVLSWTPLGGFAVVSSDNQACASGPLITDWAEAALLCFRNFKVLRWDGVSETWEMLFSDWSGDLSENPPSTLYDMAAVPDRSSVVGFASNGFFEWDGLHWKRLPDPPFQGHIPRAVTYDTVRGVVQLVVLRGNNFPRDPNELWEWTAATGAWQRRTSSFPVYAGNLAAGYHEGLQKTFYVRRDNPTYVFDGATGVLSSYPRAQPGLYFFNLLYEPVRGAFLASSSSRYYAWDETTNDWVQDITPGGSIGFSVFDVPTQRTYSIRGPDPVIHRVDWQAPELLPLGSKPQPSFSSTPRGAATLESHAAILTSDTRQVWSWNMVDQAPCHQVDLSTSSLPAMIEVQDLAVHWAGSSPADPLGVKLVGWDAGRWHDLSAAGAGPIDWLAPDAKVAAKLASDAGVRLRLAPSAPNGTGRAVVRTDYVDLRVRYVHLYGPLSVEVEDDWVAEAVVTTLSGQTARIDWDNPNWETSLHIFDGLRDRDVVVRVEMPGFAVTDVPVTMEDVGPTSIYVVPTPLP
jgi:hypothetical protein